MKSRNYILFSFRLLFFSTILKPLYDFPSNIFGIQVGIVEKIINLFFVGTVVLFIFQNRRIFINSFSILLIFILLFSTVIGIYNSTFFSVISLSQIYYFLMPLICISAGGLFYKYCILDFDNFIKEYSNYLFWCLIFLAFFYIYFHNFTSYWDYFGYSSGLVFIYLSSTSNSNFKLILGIIVDLFSGKRSTIAMWGFILSLKKPLFFLSIVLFFSLFILSLIPFIPDRYLVVFNFDILDERSMFLATGGRSVEWFGILNKINANPSGLYFGFGFGSSYELYDMFQNIWETRHYSHLTPFSYLLISGVFFTSLLYLYLIYYAFTLYNSKYLYMYYYFIVMLFLSVSGGGLLAMPLPWVYLGILLYMKKNDYKLNL